MWVGMMLPEVGQHNFNHLGDCAFADLALLEVFGCAILNSDGICDELNWLGSDCLLQNSYDIVAEQANGVEQADCAAKEQADY
jgi:hypothetical protein